MVAPHAVYSLRKLIMSNEASPAPAATERQTIEPTSARSERRSFPRTSFRSRAQAVVFPVRAGAEPVECEVMTTDISRGGVSLLYRKQLFPGQQILLVLSDSKRLVEVRWCCRAWAGLYVAGCNFVDMAPEGPIPGETSAIVPASENGSEPSS
jgi:hypothetical protein